MPTRIDLPQAAELTGFRADLYGCLGGWADALFELCDAVLCSPTPVRSVPHLSLETVFRRSYPSLHKTLGRGGSRHRSAAPGADRPPACQLAGSVRGERLHLQTLRRRDQPRARLLLPRLAALGRPADRGGLIGPVDPQLGWAGRLTDRSPGRCPRPALRRCHHRDRQPIRDLVHRLGRGGPVPLFVFDAGYDAIALSAGLAADRAAVLVRIRSDRVFYADLTPSRPALRAGRGVTATGSPAPTRAVGLPPTPN